MSADHENDLASAVNVDTQQKPFKRKIVWPNAIFFLVFHLTAVHGLYLVLMEAKLLTTLYTVFLMMLCAEGIGLGAHRLFTHRALQANSTVRLVLVALQTMASQNCLYVWVRDHRQHHKYSDTDADPHNSKRGFFFSHIGWLMSRKHPDVLEKGKTIDMSDLHADPIVMFQKRHYKKLYMAIALIIPTVVPCYFWDETLWNAFAVSFVLRVCLVLNFTWLVNSAAHAYGNRPFTKSIIPVETGMVSFLTFGEGWHNYHHTFPFDYRASELGQYCNNTTTIIDFLHRMGWVYDLKMATPEMVMSRILKHGDGTHPRLGELTKKHDDANPVPMTSGACVEESNGVVETKKHKQRSKGHV